MVDVPREKVAEQVVSAVMKNRNHVRLPKRAVVFPILAEVPRRTTELLLTGVPHQVKHSERLPTTLRSPTNKPTR